LSSKTQQALNNQKAIQTQTLLAYLLAMWQI